MPRPCLKLRNSEAEPLPFTSSPGVLLSPHVHFPPTPSLSSTHATHSPRTYDRAPIAISPNTCALPERGGRAYTTVSESWSQSQTKGSYFHPKAYEACEPEPIKVNAPAPSLCPPPLIPDLSSESDESDGAANTPPYSGMLSPIPPHLAQHTQFSPTSRSRSKDMLLDNQLSFLPHPPSPVKSKDGERKRRSPSRPRLARASYNRDVKNNDAFEQPSLDGCLGGF